MKFSCVHVCYKSILFPTSGYSVLVALKGGLCIILYIGIQLW